MSIEVRQLIVKSNVLQCGDEEAVASDSDESETGLDEETRRAVLEECKRMVMELLRERRER